MKPVPVNLAPEKKTGSRIAVVIAALMLCASLGFSVTTAYEYQANQEVIHEYQARINQVRRKAEQDRQAAADRSAGNTERQALLQNEFKNLSGLIEKSLFPVIDVLTELEKIKPDKLDITELVFSDSLKQITIRAASIHPPSVSDFLDAMGASNRFSARLTRKQIDKDNTISLELAAEWLKEYHHDTR